MRSPKIKPRGSGYAHDTPYSTVRSLFTVQLWLCLRTPTSSCTYLCKLATCTNQLSQDKEEEVHVCDDDEEEEMTMRLGIEFKLSYYCWSYLCILL